MVVAIAILFVLAVIIMGTMGVMLADKDNTISMLSYERDSLRRQLNTTPGPRIMLKEGPDELRLRETVSGLVDNGFWTEDEASAFFQACDVSPVAVSDALDDVCPECGKFYAASADDYLCPECRQNVGS